jgi:GTP cyclohydrolase I
MDKFKSYIISSKRTKNPERSVVDKVKGIYSHLENDPRSQLIKSLQDSFSNIVKGLGYKSGDVAELTPHRAAYGYLELLSGEEEYDGIEWRTFEVDPEKKQVVIVKDIPFYSFCEHHILPFWGKVSVGYLPNKEVVGLDKIPKLVSAVTHNLQLQERITNQIADVLEEKLHPLGVGVVVEANHMCVCARGIKSDCQTKTALFLGEFGKNESYQNTFFN